jgi:hypothetical protein
MQNLVITSGAFTTAGNYSGYTAKGLRVHVFGRQLKSVGWEADEDVSLPFYAIAETKTINRVDAEGNATGETAERLTALSVFKSKDDLVNAHVNDAMLDVEVAQKIHSVATEAGLTPELIAQLEAANF